jgi:hypothetical protein
MSPLCNNDLTYFSISSLCSGEYLYGLELTGTTKVAEGWHGHTLCEEEVQYVLQTHPGKQTTPFV